MKNKNHLIIASLIYLILWILTANFLIHGINSDSISYISIAEKYFNGNFYDAINAYWSPLFPWLILPAYIFNIEPHTFVRILFGVFSILFFFIVDKFFIKINLNKSLRELGIYFLILPAIFFSFYRLTPDYLLLIISLSYIFILLNEHYWEKFSLVLLSSILGVLMFLTKSYGLMFFVSFQTFLILLEFYLKRTISKKILLNYFLSLVIFTLLISPWIYLLSNKYGSFTISTSGKINIRIVNPDLNFRHPPIESGFVKPSDKFAVSAWDNPDLNQYPQWNPLSSFSNLKYITINTIKNIFKLMLFTFAFSPLLIFFLILLKKKDFTNHAILKILFSGIIYGFGYTIIYVENRYIWTSFILFTIVGLFSLNSYYDKIVRTKFFKILFVILIVCSFLPFFIYGISQQLPTTSSYYQAKEIKNKFGISGNIASTNYWHIGLAITYFLDSKFYGTEKLPINDPNLVTKAKNLGINYILDFSKHQSSVDGFKFIGKIDSIKIYKVLH